MKDEGVVPEIAVSDLAGAAECPHLPGAGACVGCLIKAFRAAREDERESALRAALEREVSLDVCARRWRVDGGVLSCTQPMEHDGACAGDWLVTDWGRPFTALDGPAEGPGARES